MAGNFTFLTSCAFSSSPSNKRERLMRDFKRPSHAHPLCVRFYPKDEPHTRPLPFLSHVLYGPLATWRYKKIRGGVRRYTTLMQEKKKQSQREIFYLFSNQLNIRRRHQISWTLDDERGTRPPAHLNHGHCPSNSTVAIG